MVKCSIVEYATFRTWHCVISIHHTQFKTILAALILRTALALPLTQKLAPVYLEAEALRPREGTLSPEAREERND